LSCQEWQWQRHHRWHLEAFCDVQAAQHFRVEDEQVRSELACRLPLIQQGGPHRGGHPTHQTEGIRHSTHPGHFGLHQVQHLVAHVDVVDASPDDQTPETLGRTHTRLMAGRPKPLGQGYEGSNITKRPKGENQDTHCDQSIGNPSTRQRQSPTRLPGTP
jgi:hypothetical protein